MEDWKDAWVGGNAGQSPSGTSLLVQAIKPILPFFQVEIVRNAKYLKR
jgi:hypothetical protein